jgi:GDSL-like Lipase/Acylhydrolase family
VHTNSTFNVTPRLGQRLRDDGVNRILTALLLVLALGVAGAAVYLFTHDDPVSKAGQTPGYQTSVPSSAPSTTSASSPSATRTRAPLVRIAFLGDDYTLGKGASSPKKRFTALVGARLDVHETTIAADGAGYAKAPTDGSDYSALVAKVVAAEPDVVVVSGGRNDVYDSADTVRSAAVKLFATLHTRLPKATLVAVAPFWGDSSPPQTLAPVAAAVKAGVTSA